MIWPTIIFLVLAAITWRIAHTSFNGLAHWLNAGADNAEVTQESELGKLILTADRYFAERKWLAAEKAYLKVLKADHKNMAAFRRLGMTYSYLHNYDDAADCLEFVINNDATAVDFQNFATILHHQNKLVEAIEAMRRSLELEPSLTRYVSLSKLYAAKGDSQSQIQALLAAHEVERHDINTIKMIIDWYKHHQDMDQSKAWQHKLDQQSLPRVR